MNILPIEFRVLGGMWCGDVVALNGSAACALCRVFSTSKIFAEGATIYEVNLGTRTLDDLVFDLLPVDGPRWQNASSDSYYLCMRHDFTGHEVPDERLIAARSRIRGRQVHASSDSDECCQLALKWYTACRAHENCHRPPDPFLPTRVIDVGKPLTDAVHLKITNGLHGKFVALSYCWGDVLPLKLTTDVIERFENSIPITSLPRTFQDAVKATRGLGLQYLWIDALCILQDDPSDVAREVSSMSRVYGDCELVLSATLSESCDGGLYSVRDAIEVEICLSKYTPFHDAGTFLVGRHHPHRIAHTECPLQDRRAWTLQERLLCPAVLHFLPYYMVWECRTICECENGEIVAEVDPFIKALPWLFGGEWTAQRYSLWTELVHKYASRSMTWKSDKLPAIAGLASYLGGHEYKNTRYLAGLWESELPWNLVWRAPQATESTTTEECQPPSWTWAAVNGSVTYSAWPGEHDSEEQHFYVDILHIDTAVGLHGSFGHVNGGRLELLGPIQEASYDSVSKSLDKRDFCVGMECFIDVEIASTECRCLLIRCLPCKQLNEGDGKSWVTDSLILSAIVDEENCFRRVGIARHWFEHETQPTPAVVFKHPVTQHLTII
jgi:hypothetical protein